MKRTYIAWILVILWMALIFYLSAQPATESRELSTGVTKVIMETIEKATPNLNLDIEWFHHFVRKNAHFFAYLILGLLLINALSNGGTKGIKSVVYSLTLSILYAASDEIHQAFVPGRGPQVSDVFIDALGALTGIVFYLFTSKLYKKWKSRAKVNLGNG